MRNAVNQRAAHTHVIGSIFMRVLIAALLLVVTPLVALAQVAQLDETTRATVVELAQRTGATVGSGVALTSVGDIVDVPELEDEPEDEPVELPELNLSDVVEYSSQGVTFQVPAGWSVTTDAGEDVPFFVEIPGTEIYITMEADAGLDFPSWLGMALFRSQADLLIGEMGEGAQLDESTTLFTRQQLPIVKLAFSGAEDGEEVGGALYVTAPNENAYLVIAGGPADQWAYAAPGVELIAQSLVFDDDMVTVERAEDEPLTYVDDDATIEAMVPAGWYVMSTGDPQFPIIAAEPEARFVATIATGAMLGDTLGPEILEELVPETGELDESRYEELFATILEAIENSGSPIIVDEELSSLQPREGAVTVRLVGDADLGDGLSIPVIFYIDLRRTDAGIVAVFGDTESATSVEAELQALLESVTGLE